MGLVVWHILLCCSAGGTMDTQKGTVLCEAPLCVRRFACATTK